MISDSITNASVTASSNARDFSKKKKKKNNKSGKMKQNKLGLCRDQWLSQVAVTSKEERREKPDHNPVENLDRLRREDYDSNGGNCFMESPSSSSVGGTNFSERSRTSSSSSSSSSSNITEEYNADDDDGCVDDWEALADALEAEDEEEEKETLLHESVKEQESLLHVVGVGDEEASSRKQRSNRAWRRPDDHHHHRPQAKQLSFPELDKRFTTASAPSSCPICCEDFDATDSSFFPCPCGFRLCLFCHKTIFDGDGRCPGCRKPYERNAIVTETSFEGGCVTVRLTRSSSMYCRS